MNPLNEITRREMLGYGISARVMPGVARLARQSTRILGVTATSVSTSAASDTIIGQVWIPAGIMGTNGILRVFAAGRATNTLGTRAVNLRFGPGDATDDSVGSTNIGAGTNITNWTMYGHIMNLDDVASQRSMILFHRAGVSPEVTNSFSTTTTVDTDTTPSGNSTDEAIAVTITGSCTDGGDAVIFDFMSVELLPNS